MDIIIDNVIINILKTSDYPYIINIIDNHLNINNENNEIIENMTSNQQSNRPNGCVYVTEYDMNRNIINRKVINASND